MVTVPKKGKITRVYSFFLMTKVDMYRHANSRLKDMQIRKIRCKKWKKTKTCKRREIEAHAFATKTRSREISANKNQIVLTEKWQESKVMNFH